MEKRIRKMHKDTEQKFLQRYKELNALQKKAVDTTEGPVLVIAGPGSGKTEILSMRVGSILKKTDVGASSILCLTFTDSAARNMRERLFSLIGPDAYRVGIFTFHGFGKDIIDRYSSHFFGGATFEPADPITARDILETILQKLPHGHPLASFHPTLGFSFFSDIKKTIEDCKRAGLSPEDLRNIFKHNKEATKALSATFCEIFEGKISKAILPKLESVVKKVDTYLKTEKPFPVPQFNSFTLSVSVSLHKALYDAKERDSTTPITEWKSKYFEKNKNGAYVFSFDADLEKLEAFADVYESYKKALYDEGYFDFDDMLLETIRGVEGNPSLLYDLQERYQYILVDEFQDTNDAQMRMIHLLTDNPVSEKEPNIMAVGDDDQAIFKFQGAELSNILSFTTRYKNIEIITLLENYRSHQDILDVAKSVIGQGVNRLENILSSVKKDLVAANKNLKESSITKHVFQTRAHEYAFVATKVKELLKQGRVAHEIAIIARTNKELTELANYFFERNITIQYEKKQNVFEEPHIRQLITLSRFIVSLYDTETDEADYLLPEILSFPFWSFDRKTVWELSKAALKTESGLWFEAMRESKDKKVKDLVLFFDSVAKMAHVTSLEEVLDTLIGSHIVKQVEESPDDDAFPEKAPAQEEKGYVSPFREYYFNQKRFKENKIEYLAFLSGLRVFIQSLREYKKGKLLSLKDLVSFVDLYERTGEILTDQSLFVGGGEAVHLLTAHKAKGLEYETVFILSCQNEVWAKGQKKSKISLPNNLPIRPSGDDTDDQLRLFYVALSRAKKELYLSHYTLSDNGKESLSLPFLIDHPKIKKEEQKAQALESKEEHALVQSFNAYTAKPYSKDEETLLFEFTKDYQLNVTHLNNFLDVTAGGPASFLEQNILRFPQAKSLSGKYGSAMHAALEHFYKEFYKTKKLPSFLFLKETFEKLLRKERMRKIDHDKYELRGTLALEIYYKERKDYFAVTDKVEVNFKNEGSYIGEAHITGKIDKLVLSDTNTLDVYDLKTGKALLDLEEKGIDYERIKKDKYIRQLLFYKLLIENSTSFKGKTVDRGVLEFLEPKDGEVVLLSTPLEKSESDRLRKLIEVVYKKIKSLDFPDTSAYEKDYSGIKKFEEDLLSGAI